VTVVGELVVGDFFFSSRSRHTRSYGDWSSDVCSSDLPYSKAQIVNLLRTEGEKWAEFVERMPQSQADELVAMPNGAPSQSRFEKIGRASCRERVEIAVGAVSLKKRVEVER